MKHNLIRLISLMLAALMLFSFVGCKEDPTTDVGVSSVIETSSGDITSDSSASEDESSNEDSSEDTETSSRQPVTSEESSSGRPVSSDSSSSSRPVSSNESSSRPVSSRDEVTSDEPSSEYVSSEEEPAEEYEKPNAGNDTVLFNKQTSKYDSQANTLRQKIINAKDSGLKGAKTYYVSYKGSDYNSGTSPDSPWQTISKVNSAYMPSNSVVLFERGGVYRGSLQLKSNTSYGAYGSGSKPCIYGSKMNYADESLWTPSTKYDNAWQIEVDEADVGQIVFDHGKKVATKIPQGTKQPSEYMFTITRDGILHLFVSNNPAKLYDDIEISGYNHVLYVSSNGGKNIVVENLCIKYGGRHGMSFPFTENITVRNCEVGYIGGVGGSVPLGNGIEFWLDTKNVTVENCWVYQCFDAGITNQGQRNDGKANVQEGITYKDNLIEYCTYGIEYFAGQGSAGSTIKNTLYTGNIIRFSGMGWCRPSTRLNETLAKSAVSAINGWTSNPNVGNFPAENFVIENNILDTSWRHLINVVEPNTSGKVIVRNNTYYQKSSDTATVGFDSNKTPILITSESQMKAEIAKIDSSPKSVELD